MPWGVQWLAASDERMAFRSLRVEEREALSSERVTSSVHDDFGVAPSQEREWLRLGYLIGEGLT
jgi:hypothetical protein